MSAQDEMSPGVQSRDDTRVPDGHEERDLDCISAGELSSAFGLPCWVGIELLCRCGNPLGQSPKARLVVMMTEVRSYSGLIR